MSDRIPNGVIKRTGSVMLQRHESHLMKPNRIKYSETNNIFGYQAAPNTSDAWTSSIDSWSHSCRCLLSFDQSFSVVETHSMDTAKCCWDRASATSMIHQSISSCRAYTQQMDKINGLNKGRGFESPTGRAWKIPAQNNSSPSDQMNLEVWEKQRQTGSAEQELKERLSLWKP